MTVRPGTTVEFGQEVPVKGAPTDTGVMFIAGQASKGPTDQALLCYNMDDVTSKFGARIPSGSTTPTSLLWDTCDAAFKTGVTRMWVGRFAGPAATPASATLEDDGGTPAAAITVKSNGPGPSTLQANVIVSPNNPDGVQIQIIDSVTEIVLDQSPTLVSNADCVQWARFAPANLVRIVSAGANLPAVTEEPVALAGGGDDHAHITDGTRTAALPILFPKRLGPGQIVIPEAGTAAMKAAISDYCATVQNKVCLLDGPDTADKATALAAETAWRAACTVPLSETYGMFTSPWRVVPGTNGSFSRVVGPSAIIAGIVAKSDAVGGNPNLAAAGANGKDPYSLGSSQPEWTEADMTVLNDAGIASFRNIYGDERLYGFRSGAYPADVNPASAMWTDFSAARLRMAITNDLNAIGEQFLFDQLDGQGRTIAEFNGAITGKLLEYYNLGALYGATPSQAFVVDTGPTVNTPTTIANGELHSKIGIKISPFAEMVIFEVTSVALTEGLAA